MTKIDIGFDIKLEKLIETRALIQANSGGGKSYLIRKLIEQIHGKVPYIVLDLEGEFITIREKYDVIVFGQGHDIPINIQYADKLARYLLELSANAIIDLSELKHHERIIFVRRFLESMIAAPQALWHPTVVLLDEAHQFCPEDGKCESMNAVIDLCTRGRKRGYCAVLATQRLSKLNKDAAAELNNKLIGRTTLDVDVKRTAAELGMNPKDAKQQLRQLDEGEFYVFGPAISNEVTRQKVSQVRTTHVKTGMKFSRITPPSKTLQKIIGKIAQIPAEVEQELDTVKELNEQVKKLKAELRSKQSATTAAPAKVIVDNGAITVMKNHIALLEKCIQQHEARATTLISRLRKVKDTSNAEMDALLQLKPIDKVIPPLKSESAGSMPTKIIPVPESKRIPAPFHEEGTSSSSKLGKCEKSILTVLVQEEKAVTKSKIAIRSGYSANSGGFNNALGKLRSLGYIEGRGDTKITDAGREELGNYKPLPNPGDELCQYWIKELPKCESMILAHLIDFYPQACSKEGIANATQYSVNSGGFNNALGKLRTLELIEGRGEIKASDSLFE